MSNIKLYSCLLCILGFSINAQITNGQLVHYPMNGNLLDIGLNGLNATSLNPPMPATDSDGNTNSALSFNGSNQRMDLPNSPIIRPTTFPVTFSFWFNVPHFGASGNQKLFITNFNTAAYFGYYCNLRNNNLELSYGDGTGLSPNNRRSFFINYTFQTNTWYHIVITVLSSTQANAWVNCNSANVSTGGSGGNIVYGNDPGYIGVGRLNTIVNTPQYLEGTLDEFRMWNRSLTSAEIQLICDLQNCQDSTYFQDNFCIGSQYDFNGQILNSAGRYSQTLTNNNGCDSIAVLDLGQSSADSTYLQDNFCIGAQYNFNGQTLNAPGRYSQTLVNLSGCDSILVLDLSQSNIADTTQLTETICDGDSYLFAGNQLSIPGQYSEVYPDPSGCDSVVQLNLRVLPNNDTLWVTQEGNACSLGYIVLRAHNNQGQIVWNNGQMTDTLIVNSNGPVGVRSIDSCGVSSLSILVDEDCFDDEELLPMELFIPNVFTPNGDVKNEFFEVQGTGIDRYEIIIFNRWGGEVFRSNDISIPWDGTFEGREVSSGVYLYLIRYSHIGQDIQEKTGFLTLFR
jgi:gliding motility-associated-like protein